jgi:hypothetical protein
MPTPDEDSVAVPPSPPVETNSLRSSCPPEDERLTSNRPRADSIHEDEGRTTGSRQQPTPEPDTPQEEAEKGEHIEDAAVGASRTVREGEESPSPVSSPDAPGDGWTAHSVVGRVEDASRGTAEGGEGEVGARYLKYPPLRRDAVSTPSIRIACRF